MKFLGTVSSFVFCIFLISHLSLTKLHCGVILFQLLSTEEKEEAYETKPTIQSTKLLLSQEEFPFPWLSFLSASTIYCVRPVAVAIFSCGKCQAHLSL